MLATNLQCVVFAYFRYPQSLSQPQQEINMRHKINFTWQTYVPRYETNNRAAELIFAHHKTCFQALKPM